MIGRLSGKLRQLGKVMPLLLGLRAYSNQDLHPTLLKPWCDLANVAYMAPL